MTPPHSTSPLPDCYRHWLTQPLSREEIARRGETIASRLRLGSPRLADVNFQAIATSDLALLFALYDEIVFASRLRQLLQAQGAPLEFTLSRRLTRSAGTATRHRLRHPQPGEPAVRYEIAISVPLLYQSFGDVERPIRVSGLVCRHRVEALQRIFEHELLHLVEMLVLGKSSCSAPPFRMLAHNLFGHTQTKHDLVTQTERAEVQFAIRVGDRVTFDFEGRTYTGVVNRITRRATILVENPAGQRYTDGRHYQKFYVPLAQLHKLA
jgi:hypothetical protein